MISALELDGLAEELAHRQGLKLDCGSRTRMRFPEVVRISCLARRAAQHARERLAGDVQLGCDDALRAVQAGSRRERLSYAELDNASRAN